MYGKLVNGQLQYVSNQLIIDDMLVVNPTNEEYEAQGYLEVVNTEYPNVEEGFVANPHYEQQENKIVQVWTIEKENQPPTLEEQVATLSDYILNHVG